MSTVVENIVDLSLYGCPMHYIKAREAIRLINIGEHVLFQVNNGKAVDDVLRSLRHDGQRCEISVKETVSTIIKVTKIL
ncbi:MAG: sulfurtransferase TusA family protein [Piscirickettsiaceae bacterium]|nr:sulfurtransferase TusA family protein [Piscirickettsiaceae bacterium]